jgi:hypothetical protein
VVHVKRLVIVVTTVALIAGVVGCRPYPSPSEDLEIRTWYDLDAVRDNLLGTHTLINDLDSTTPGYEELASPAANGGKGWQPIGIYHPYGPTMFTGFMGTLDGQGYEIRDLFINRPDEDDVGVFKYVDDGFIADIGVPNVTVIGGNAVGGLAGINVGTVSNCYCSGNVSGNDQVGGLVGATDADSTVTGSRFRGSVIGSTEVGGLAGKNSGTVSNSHSTGNVAGIDEVGGLVGSQFFGIVTNCYSTGIVSGNSCVGGLVGLIFSSGFDQHGDSWVIESCFSGSVSGESGVGGLVGENQCSVSSSHSAGSVSGREHVGGLVGRNLGPVSNSYSSGDITGDSHVGGLVGGNDILGTLLYGTVSNSYSAGAVTGTFYAGGLMGTNSCNVTDSFWDMETSGHSTSDGGTGKTTTEMKDIATFSGAGWNIIAVAPGERNTAYVWSIVDGQTYPFLNWEP